MRTILLTFDDAVTSQYELAAPLLVQYGFGATFYACRFPDTWREKHSAHLLRAEQLKALHEMGFEIANHTWNHPDLRQCGEAAVCHELDSLTGYMTAAGIPAPVSFAYPGGPFAGNAVPALKRRGFRSARSTEQRTFNRKRDDWMNLPSFPIQGNNERLFLNAVARADGEEAVCLVFHGTPEYVHPWVNTDFPRFAEYMYYLKENGFRVMSVRDFLTE